MCKPTKFILLCICIFYINLVWGLNESIRDSIEVIFAESFDAITAPNLPTGWTVINNDNDHQLWKTHSISPISPPNSLWSAYSNFAPKDDFLVTPGLELTAGQTYYVSFNFRSGDRAVEKFRVLLGTEPTVAALTTMVYNNPGFNSDVPQTATATFTISTTDTYYLAWQCLFGLIYFLPLFLYYDGAHFFSMKHNAMGLGTIAAMSVFASVGAFLLYTGVIRDLGVSKSNVFTNLIPVFTVTLAFFILGDRLTLLAAIGLILTLVGLVLSQYKDLRRLHSTYLQKQKNYPGLPISQP